MKSRREDQGFCNVVNRYLREGIIVGLILAFAIFLIGFAIQGKEKKEARKINSFIKALEGSSVEEGKSGEKGIAAIKKRLGVVKFTEEQRQLVMTMFLAADDYGEGSAVISRVIKEHQKRIGENIALKSASIVPAPIPSWKSMLKFCGVVSWLIFWICVFVCYAMETENRSERLVDLPWKKPWAWIFFALTLPIGFPFYISSTVSWMGDRKEEVARERERRQAIAEQEARIAEAEAREEEVRARRAEIVARMAEREVMDEEDDHCDIDIEEVAQRVAEERELLQLKTQGAMSPPKIAESKENWRQIHGEFLFEKWERKKEQRQDRVNDLRSELIRLGQLIRDKQDKLAEAQRDLRRVENAEPREEDSTTLDDTEFERLLSFPIVLAAEVLRDEVSAWTKPVIFEDKGRKFDLGNYLVKVIDLDTDDPEIQVICVVSGRLDGEKTHLYGGGWGGDFCFGSRGDHIQELLEKGETLAAIDLALQGVCFVNKSNRPELPDYLEVTDEENSEHEHAA
jgi:hypothetical protein